MKNSIRSIALITALTGISAPVLAENTWKDGAKDAWVDGKVETVLLLNTNLNSFDINTDVKNGEVLLTGKVDSEVDKALAQELIAKLDGVESVSNRLSVVNQKGDLDKDNVQTLLDAKIETVVKSKLLFESEVKGMDIEVDVEQGVVTLTGMVNSNAAKDLAGAISKNTNDVLNVEEIGVGCAVPLAGPSVVCVSDVPLFPVVRGVVESRVIRRVKRAEGIVEAAILSGFRACDRGVTILEIIAMKKACAARSAGIVDRVVRK